jgi:Mrp family chromosome partitioning ATPase
MPNHPVTEPGAVEQRMKKIKHKIVVLSGKGGVGKSTVSAHLALSLAAKGSSVGLLDADIHGPSVPTLFNMTGQTAIQRGEDIVPLEAGGIKLMSSGFMIAHPDQAIIVRGPMKNSILEQMLGQVDWGTLDYLIIDCPPGTGDEPLGICQLINRPDGGVLVTTPQEVAAADVRKSIEFCRKLNLPILGILENMSGYACPKCGEEIHLFGKDGGRKTAEKYNEAFLGKIPIDPAVGLCGDAGKNFLEHHADSPAAAAFEKAVGLMSDALALLPKPSPATCDNACGGCPSSSSCPSAKQGA